VAIGKVKTQEGNHLMSRKRGNAMGHVLLDTVGTAGDVVPFLQLGRGLKACGHRVTLASHCYYEKESRQMGLDFVSLDTPTEFEDFIKDGVLLNRNADVPRFLRRHVLPQTLSHCKLLEQSCTPETIVISRSAPGIAARLVAEKHRLPLVSVLMTPSHVTTLKVVEALLATLGSEINDIRASFGLAPVKQWGSWWRSVEHYLGLWPAWLSPCPSELPAPVTLTGFLWQESQAENTIPDEISSFLEGQPAPVLISGGTGIFGGQEFFKVSVEACQRLNRPTILVARLPEILPANLPDNVHWFKQVPSMMALVNRSGVIIHHGGMGILSQALSAGIPQVILAAGGDRPDNAILAQRLGVGRFLSRPHWYAEDVLQSLMHLLTSDAVAQRCKEVAHQLQHQHAIQVACESIEAIMNNGVSHERKLASADNLASGINTFPQDNSKVENIRQSLNQLSPKQRAYLMSRLRHEKPGT
jgi:rhamnosyltransferase subunit B